MNSSDTSPSGFVVVADFYNRRSRAHNALLAGRTDVEYAGLWGRAQVYVMCNFEGQYTLFAKTPARPHFHPICVLEERKSASGKPVLFGRWDGTRVYIVENEADRHPKDCLPDFQLLVRIEDWLAHKGQAPEGESK